MEIVLIAAVDINLAIGKEGKIPWDIKEDLKFFRQNTENTAIVMGRATYDSIGRPLPNRKNIVMTRSIQGRDGVVEVSSSQEAINEARSYSEKVNKRTEVKYPYGPRYIIRTGGLIIRTGEVGNQ